MNYPPIQAESNSGALMYLMYWGLNCFIVTVVITIFVAALLYIRNHWKRRN